MALDRARDDSFDGAAESRSVGGRPEHGGRDRHFCVGVKDLGGLQERLDAAGVVYTMSKSGRKAMFFRDPDMNCLEFVEMEAWR